MDVMGLRRGLLSMIGGKIKMIETGTYTPTEDVKTSQIHIAHSLGVIPEFVIVMADAFEATADLTDRYTSTVFCSKANLIASNKNANGVGFYQTNYANNTTNWKTSEDINYTKFLHETTFEIPFYNTGEMLKAGITYHYVLGTYE